MTRFGRSVLAEWALDEQVVYLNHGTVGATPRRVLEAQRRLVDEIERQPSRFMLREVSALAGPGAAAANPSRMRAAAANSID